MVSKNLYPPEHEDSAGMGFYLNSVLKTFIFLKFRGPLFKACLSKLPSVPCRKSFFKSMVSTKNRTYCLIIHSANSGKGKELKVAGCSQKKEMGEKNGDMIKTWGRQQHGSWVWVSLILRTLQLRKSVQGEFRKMGNSLLYDKVFFLMVCLWFSSTTDFFDTWHFSHKAAQEIKTAQKEQPDGE